MLCSDKARVKGVSMVIAAWGEGVCVSCPPPPRRIARRSPNTRVKNWLGLKVLNYAGARGMDVSMVIAAWGEGVGVHVSPSPSPDRSSSAKTRVKIAGWVPGHAPIRRARSRPPPRAKLIRQYRNVTEILRRTFSFFLHTCATVLTHWHIIG
jgi:hypothetical protein